MSEETLERFKPTGGTVSGVIALVFAAVIIGSWVRDRDSISAAAAAVTLVAAVLVWSAALRPRVAVGEQTLVLRNMFETVRIPVAAVEEITVRQVLVVRAGGKRYVNPAIGRTRRELVRPGRTPFSSHLPGGSARMSIDYADFVVDRIRHLAKEARVREGAPEPSADPSPQVVDVERQPAWPEIVAIVVAVGLLIAAIVA